LARHIFKGLTQKPRARSGGHPAATGGRHGQRDAAFAIELKGISKAFGPVQANKDINIAVPRARSTASSAKTARGNPR
jgi:hypothetical protein